MSFQVQLHLRHPIGTEAPPISPCLGVPRCWSCHRLTKFAVHLGPLYLCIITADSCQRFHIYISVFQCFGVFVQIRPHRFGGEGVLIGGQNSNTKCSMTFVNIAVAISALAGGPKNGFAPRPEYGGVFDIFRGFLGV